MNEGKVNILKCFAYSISGTDRYRILLRQSTGKAVGCVILLSFLLSIVVFAPVYKIAFEVTGGIESYINEKLPDFKLVNGHLEVYGEMPVVIDEEDDLPVVIDTTPGAEDTILSQYDNVILVTSDKVIAKNYVNRQEYTLSSFEGFEISKTSVLESLPLIKGTVIFLFIVIFIFASAFFVGIKFLSALVVGVIGLAANSAFRTNLAFGDIYKLSLFAMTLPLIICTVIDVLIFSPITTVLFYIGSGIFIYGAIRSISKDPGAAGGSNHHEVDPFSGSNYRYPGEYDQNYGYGNRPFPRDPGFDAGSNNAGTGSDKPADAPENGPAKDPDSSDPHGPVSEPAKDQQDSSESNEGDES